MNFDRVKVKGGSWSTGVTYEEIVESFGVILASAEESGYQGDSLYLIRGEAGYGVLIFGWGSCSGCDALEACQSQKDVDELQDDLYRGIEWFDTLSEAKAHVAQKYDPEPGEYDTPTYLDPRLRYDFAKAVDNV